MRNKKRQSGLTLMEQVVVITSVAVLITIAMPTVKSLFSTMETPAGTKALISSALASAKAIAAREQRYAGIRFQHAYDVDNPQDSPLKQPQYIIFIINDHAATKLAKGFRAVEGLDPIKLPKSIGVMDLYVMDSTGKNKNYPIDKNTGDTILGSQSGLSDATTFSIVFSPAGKLVVTDVRTRNRDGANENENDSEDDIFNTEDQVDDEIAMFIQDSNRQYSPRNILNLEQEPSRRAFVIYDRNEFKTVDESKRYTEYIEDIEPVFLNPHTGQMIDR